MFTLAGEAVVDDAPCTAHVSAGDHAAVRLLAGNPICRLCALGHYGVRGVGLREDMPMAFEQTLTVGWRDLDANGHMANTSYLDKSVDVRAAYMSSRGVSVAELQRRRVGPFAMRDELEYRREFAFQDSVRATLEVAGLSDDGSRWRLRNAFFHGDDLAAEVLTLGAWVNLSQRKLISPDEKLREVFRSLDQTDGFEVLPSLVR